MIIIIVSIQPAKHTLMSIQQLKKKDEIKLKKCSGNEQGSPIIADFDVPPVGEIDGMNGPS